MARDDRDPLLEEFSVRMSVIKWPSGLLLVGRRVALCCNVNNPIFLFINERVS